MTELQIPRAGLDEDQWQQLKLLATSLTPDQSMWVGGYFTGYAEALRRQPLDGVPPPAAAQGLPNSTAVKGRSLSVFCATETGNGMAIAEALESRATSMGRDVKLVDLADYKPARLRDEQDALFIVSTHGEGDWPQTAVAFFEHLHSRKAARLDGLRFAVLALGDSTYEFFCEAGKRLDRRLEELGAERLAPRIDCDVDQLGAGELKILAILEGLERTSAPVATTAQASPLQPAPVEYGPSNPFHAEVQENLVLTGRGSSKETRHVELSLAGSDLAYQPGDALGIVPRNDPLVVETLLDTLGLDGRAPITVNGAASTLEAALRSGYEIAQATPRFLQSWAVLSGARELADLVAEDRRSERFSFLEGHHIIDIAEIYPVPGLQAEQFVSALRPLQPRLYSIASSLVAAEQEAHLTVSTVRYSLHGRERLGAVSGWLGKLPEEASLPVYIKPNPHFRLPGDDVPIIMVGAGTGVAPYRAFLQERAATGRSGRSWLFFGERNFRSDFLYQVEWQEHLKDGTLTRMDVAFSRDGMVKTYVQHRMLEQAQDIYGWLEEGAHFYLCGDAKALAPDVHAALVQVVANAGATNLADAQEYVTALQAAGRYHKDVY